MRKALPSGGACACAGANASACAGCDEGKGDVDGEGEAEFRVEGEDECRRVCVGMGVSKGEGRRWWDICWRVWWKGRRCGSWSLCGCGCRGGYVCARGSRDQSRTAGPIL